MAVVRSERASKVTVVVNAGTSASPSYKNRIFNHFAPDLTDEKCYQIGESLGGLQAHTVEKIQRTEVSTLEENA